LVQGTENTVVNSQTWSVHLAGPDKSRLPLYGDLGGQPLSARFRDLCLSNGIVPSVGNTGICFDNAAAESFNATLKKELIHLHAWSGVKKVRQAVFGFVS
jgi:transposase InsO family protein